MPPKHLTAEELREKAKKELNEDSGRTLEDIDSLRQWMIKQPHIHGRTDDQTLLQFLRNCKFSLEAAKKKIENFYTAKTSLSQFFLNTDPTASYMRHLLEIGALVALGYDHKGRRILLGRLSIVCKEKIAFEFCMRMLHIVSTYMLTDVQTQVCGITIMADYKDVDASLLAIVTPMNLKNALYCLQDCMPLRLQLLLPFNTGPIFDILFGIGKVFLKEKLLKRLRFPGSSLEALHSVIPADCLVKEYGGTLDLQYYINKTTREVMSLRDYLVEDESYCAIESKRVGAKIREVDQFGTSGSFRKLNVD